jgi:thymidylate synthase
MEQLKLLLVKTNDDCISWTPKHADYFLGSSFFENSNYYFIFGKKSLDTVPFIKALYDSYPYKCLVLSRNFTFPKLVSNINIYSNKEIIYWVLGGKMVFTLFDKLVSEIICINISINAMPHPEGVYYNFPIENFEMTKVAQKNFDYFKKKLNYDIITYKNKMTSFNGWISMENEYLKLSKYLIENNYNPTTIFSEKITLDLSKDNFPILTTREIESRLFSNEAISLYNQYVLHFGENITHNQLVKNGQHLIQFWCFSHQNIITEKNDNYLSIQVYIPESKYFEQLPFDISVYCLFLILLCQKIKNVQPRNVHLVIGKLSFTYETINLIKEQVKRCPLPFPILKISIDENNDFTKNIKIDFENYYYWPKLSNN